MRYPETSIIPGWQRWIWLLAILLAGCSTCSVRNSVHAAGEKAGVVIGEAAQGVSRGVENAFQIHIEKKSGAGLDAISFGEIRLRSDSTGNDNLLSVYVIFQSDFSREVTIKVYNQNGLESGRKKQLLQGRKDDAGFVDFVFDPRTNIDRDCRIVME